jgi:hypothetical protein
VYLTYCPYFLKSSDFRWEINCNYDMCRQYSIVRHNSLGQFSDLLDDDELIVCLSFFWSGVFVFVGSCSTFYDWCDDTPDVILLLCFICCSLVVVTCWLAHIIPLPPVSFVSASVIVWDCCFPSKTNGNVFRWFSWHSWFIELFLVSSRHIVLGGLVVISEMSLGLTVRCTGIFKLSGAFSF